MAEGLKIVNELWRLAQEQERIHNHFQLPGEVYIGLNLAVLLLSEPSNSGLWHRLVDYIGEAADA